MELFRDEFIKSFGVPAVKRVCRLEIQKRERQAWEEYQVEKEEKLRALRLEQEKAKPSDDKNKNKSDTKWAIFSRCK